MRARTRLISMSRIRTFLEDSSGPASRGVVLGGVTYIAAHTEDGACVWIEPCVREGMDRQAIGGSGG